MKHEQNKSAPSLEQPTTPEVRVKKPYTRPEVLSESLFESAALGAGKLIDQFPITCSEISQS